MKILAIGDTHGENWWRSIVFGSDDLYASYKEDKEKLQNKFKFNFENIPKIIFLGDYVDSYFVSTIDMIDELKEIVQLARNYPDKVELLLGNHDIQYINTKYQCSGFRPEAYFDLRDIFDENRDIFKAASVYGDYLFSHAGVTQRFWDICEKHLKTVKHLYDYTDPEKNIADHLNFLYESNFEPVFYAGRARGGYASTPGLFWADKRELIANPLKGYNQVVGHTKLEKKMMISLEDSKNLFFIDTMNAEASELFNIGDIQISDKFSTIRGMKY